MPTYCYICHNCGQRTEETHTVEFARFRPACPRPSCEAVMHRDWQGEGVSGKADKEYCQRDVARYVQQAADNKQVDEPVLSKSLAKVPGIPKVKAPDGKTYAAFRNRAHRRKVLKHIGAVDLDS